MHRILRDGPYRALGRLHMNGINILNFVSSIKCCIIWRAWLVVRLGYRHMTSEQGRLSGN